MATKSVRYLASVIAALKVLCKIFPLAAQSVRGKLPEENLAVYDACVAAVNAACEMLQTVDIIGDGAGSN